MNDNEALIIERFNQIKALGFVRSNRKNNTGIGKTFEDYIGVVENNIDEPDLFGYEIKSHREETSSYITLFTKSPNFPPKANSYLKDKYGIPYENNPCLKKLHTSMFASKFNTFTGLYSFRLLNDSIHNAIRIGVFDYNTKELIDDTVGYTYDCIEDILKKKLKNLFYVSAEREIKDGDEYFFFNEEEY
ncbi:MAG: MvaI/BcnI restriction endonuclease family protein [bacterium]|uniref:MvaI/BcnI restriction endonuclease family protein n=1 Tax=Candidatus Aphodosoma intestinipullorum TaxID=2840674 RepID=A0A940DJT9_9BACT|nr:MvaI/BcnI restriction endonuclease family protein [Candidatus Aphodosoma intestinipullorum]